MSETPLIDGILLAASARGWRLFRQNTGMGWVGKIAGRKGANITLENARPLHAGLCVGSSDIIGIAPVVITPDMVGQTVGVFVAIEVKTVGVPVSTDQAKFTAMIKRLGGKAIIARDVSDIDLC